MVIYFFSVKDNHRYKILETNKFFKKIQTLDFLKKTSKPQNFAQLSQFVEPSYRKKKQTCMLGLETFVDVMKSK